VSIGAMAQPTAIAIMEQETHKTDGWGVETAAMRVRHLEQIEAKAGYPVIVERVRKLIESEAVKCEEQTKEGADLIVDTSGLGRAVGTLMRERGMSPATVTLSNSAGEVETPDGPSDWRLGRSDLIGNLQVAYEARRIKLAEGMPLVAVLESALQSFELRRSSVATLQDIAEGLREMENDELVYAVALCAWRASRHKPTPPSVTAHWDRKIDDFNRRRNSSIV
jgi:hypothetical protein